MKSSQQKEHSSAAGKVTEGLFWCWPRVTDFVAGPSLQPIGRAVLTNGHTGHVPRAPGFFFFLRGPQLAVVKYIFKSNYLIVDATA